MGSLFEKIGTNWKTSAAGIGMILGALGDIAHNISVGTPVNFSVSLTAIVAGIGLLAAKDSNVTGGTKQQ